MLIADFIKLGAMAGIGIESVFSEKISANLFFLFIQKGSKKTLTLAKVIIISILP
jgi:hypothetical protein